LKRPYDQPSQDRIVLEGLAVAAIVKAHESLRLEVVSSTVLELENSKNPQLDRKTEVADLLRRFRTRIYSGPEILQRGGELVALGLRAVDALHIACAESGQCQYFITCDDQLLAVATRLADRLRVKVIGPLALASQLEREDQP
jgi:predicted nucleic acid-binding protein